MLRAVLICKHAAVMCHNHYSHCGTSIALARACSTQIAPIKRPTQRRMVGVIVDTGFAQSLLRMYAATLLTFDTLCRQPPTAIQRSQHGARL